MAGSSSHQEAGEEQQRHHNRHRGGHHHHHQQNKPTSSMKFSMIPPLPGSVDRENKSSINRNRSSSGSTGSSSRRGGGGSFSNSKSSKVPPLPLPSSDHNHHLHNHHRQQSQPSANNKQQHHQQQYTPGAATSKPEPQYRRRQPLGQHRGSCTPTTSTNGTTDALLSASFTNNTTASTVASASPSLGALHNNNNHSPALSESLSTSLMATGTTSASKRESSPSLGVGVPPNHSKAPDLLSTSHATTATKKRSSSPSLRGVLNNSNNNQSSSGGGVLRYGERMETLFGITSSSSEEYKRLCWKLAYGGTSDDEDAAATWRRVLEIVTATASSNSDAASSFDILKLHRRATLTLTSSSSSGSRGNDSSNKNGENMKAIWLSYARVQLDHGLKDDARITLKHIQNQYIMSSSMQQSPAGTDDDVAKLLVEIENQQKQQRKNCSSGDNAASSSSLSSQKRGAEHGPLSAPSFSSSSSSSSSLKRLKTESPTIQEQSRPSEEKSNAVSTKTIASDDNSRAEASWSSDSNSKTLVKKEPQQPVVRKALAPIPLLTTTTTVTSHSSAKDGARPQEVTASNNKIIQQRSNQDPSLSTNNNKLTTATNPNVALRDNNNPRPSSSLLLAASARATSGSKGGSNRRSSRPPLLSKGLTRLKRTGGGNLGMPRRGVDPNSSSAMLLDDSDDSEDEKEEEEKQGKCAQKQKKGPKITRMDLSYMLEWDPDKRDKQSSFSATACGTDSDKSKEVIDFCSPTLDTLEEEHTSSSKEIKKSTTTPSKETSEKQQRQQVEEPDDDKTEKRKRFSSSDEKQVEEDDDRTEKRRCFSSSSGEKQRASTNATTVNSLSQQTEAAAETSSALKLVEEANIDFLPLVREKNMLKVNGVPYAKLGVIGRGASCKVHRALSKDCTVFAIKKVKIGGMAKSAVKGYANEISLLKQLRGNPAIIQMHDYELDLSRKALFVVLEVGEVDLNHVLHQQQKDRNLSMNFIRLTWQQMLSAVHSIHEARIVHGDLKPANFLFVRGALKLIDFGIAKAIQSDETTNIYRENQMGTLNYMSPESLSDSGSGMGAGLKIGRASDIWSLGCILYQMVYGKTPFADVQQFVQKMQAIINPNYKINFPEGADEGAVDAMKQCLRRRATERPPIVGPGGLLSEHKFLNNSHRSST